MGNGHPVAAVVTTRHVAERFKLPYFNTVCVSQTLILLALFKLSCICILYRVAE